MNKKDAFDMEGQLRERRKHFNRQSLEYIFENSNEANLFGSLLRPEFKNTTMELIIDGIISRYGYPKIPGYFKEAFRNAIIFCLCAFKTSDILLNFAISTPKNFDNVNISNLQDFCRKHNWLPGVLLQGNFFFDKFENFVYHGYKFIDIINNRREINNLNYWDISQSALVLMSNSDIEIHSRDWEEAKRIKLIQIKKNLLEFNLDLKIKFANFAEILFLIAGLFIRRPNWLLPQSRYGRIIAEPVFDNIKMNKNFFISYGPNRNGLKLGVMKADEKISSGCNNLVFPLIIVWESKNN